MKYDKQELDKFIAKQSDDLIRLSAENVKLRASVWNEAANRLEEIADRAAEGHHPYCGPSMPSEVFILRNLAEEFRKKS